MEKNPTNQSARYSRRFFVTELAVSGPQCTLHSVYTVETTCHASDQSVVGCQVGLVYQKRQIKYLVL